MATYGGVAVLLILLVRRCMNERLLTELRVLKTNFRTEFGRSSVVTCLTVRSATASAFVKGYCQEGRSVLPYDARDPSKTKADVFITTLPRDAMRCACLDFDARLARASTHRSPAGLETSAGQSNSVSRYI